MTQTTNLIERYWQMPFVNLHKIKKKTHDELKQALAQFSVPPEFVFPPYQHQLACFLLAMKYPGLFLALDMGTGKSKIILDVFSYRRRLSEETQHAKRMLILVPNQSNVGTWGEQLRTHAPQLTYALLTEDQGRVSREFMWNDTSRDCVVMTYSGFVQLLKTPMSRKTKKRRTYELSQDKIDQIPQLFDSVTLDESSYIASPDNITTKILLGIAHRIKFRYALSGTPFNSDPIGLWSQMYFCDLGETLTKRLGIFCQLFFIRVATRNGLQWKLRDAMQKTLHRVLGHRSIRYRVSECLTLPQCLGGLVNPIIVPVEPTKHQRLFEQKTYQQMMQNKNSYEALTGLFLRLRRAASGYAELPNQKDVFEHFAENPKLDACVDLLRSMSPRKCIVVVYYQETARLLELKFAEYEAERKKDPTKVRFDCRALVGGRSDHRSCIESFNNPEGVRLLILSTAGSKGLNLQFCCSDMIMFEAPVSMVERTQMEARIYREGQKNVVRIYDLVAPIDAKIMYAHRNKKEVLDVVLDGKSGVVA